MFADTLPGSPDTNAGGNDAFVVKYDASGTKIWVHQLGSSGDDLGVAVAVGATSGPYITGETNGTLPGSPETNVSSNYDAFLAKYDASGNKLWVHQIDSSSANVPADGVAVDVAGNSYIVGGTAATLPGSPEPNAGIVDSYIAGYDTAGNLAGIHQLGSPSVDAGLAAAVDASGNVYETGETFGTLPGSPEVNAGSSDAFVARYATVLSAPDAPTIGAATAGNASASVTFTPNGNGGSPVLHFDATCLSSNGGVTRSASAAGSPIVVSGLSNGFTYTCTVTATNAVGTSIPSSATNAFVPTPPGGGPPPVGGGGGCTTPTAPRVPKATAGDGRAIVAWKAPLTGCVLAYFVTPYVGFAAQPPQLFGSGVVSAAVTGLTNGKTYRFRVVAEGVSGNGPASLASNAVTVGAPAPPTAVTATRLTKGSLRIRFTAPANNGAAITSYAATCSSSNAGIAKTRTGKASPIAVTGLTKGKTYTCIVTAINSRGAGPSSAASPPIVA